MSRIMKQLKSPEKTVFIRMDEGRRNFQMDERKPGQSGINFQNGFPAATDGYSVCCQVRVFIE
ncbi:hypothetical cytosolic protein [Syntrophus aciditrophicus SB]|uniref:Hypothetical cytosolic protein n=1 Tax=Syntrophus aciditrophicus (strain SB) TaxID=56780 RepID=Q2LSZ9_SYNAS|nr:hypothetical cytosolic protein [Syntrophus aciditrophicus SB]